MKAGIFSKFELVKSMHTIVKNLNNDDAYCEWLYIVPDGAEDEDFYDIALDEVLFNATIKCFKEIMKHYLKDGIYIDEKLY